MATATPTTPAPAAPPSDEKTNAQPESARTKFDQIQAKAQESAHAAGQDIARHLHDLEKTNAKHVARAKREVKADVAKVRKATAKLGNALARNKK